MMEYFDELLRANEWEKASKYADQLLRDQAISELEVVRIYYGLCEARLYLRDYSGSEVAGRLAADQALSLNAWDQYGIACLALSCTYLAIGDSDGAENVLTDFLSQLHNYSAETRGHEADVWFNVGKTYMKRGNGIDAGRAYSKALKAAEGRLPAVHVHSIRQSLIEAHLKTGNLGQIPRLLAGCAYYLRHAGAIDNPHRISRLTHLRLRADYALANQRFRRARSLALFGLSECQGLPRHQFTFHMLLARIAEQCGSPLDAVGHSTAARVYAIEYRRHDLETESNEFTYKITSQYPGILERVDNHYFGS